MTQQTLSLAPSADSIVRDIYADLPNRGLVDQFIQPGAGTADFDLPEHHILRVKEDRTGVYYNIFRR